MRRSSSLGQAGRGGALSQPPDPSRAVEHRLLLATKHRLHHPTPSPSTIEHSTRALRSSSPFWGALATI